MQFSFAAGLEYHPSGLGMWELNLTESGELLIVWKRGQVASFGPFQVGREAVERVWGLIEKMDFSMQASDSRMGLPDEAMYTFMLHSGSERHTLNLWHGDIQQFPSVQVVLLEINGLIERFTGQKAHL